MNHRNIKRIVLLGLIASVGLTSCQVLNKYKAPEVDSSELFRDQHATDTITIANIPWKTYFADPLLQNLIDEGLRNNFDLQIAVTRIQQAEANLGMAKAAYYPDVALVGQVNQTRSSFGADGKDVLGYQSTSYSLGVSASWEADIWGKLNRQSRAKKAQLLNSHAYRNLVQTSLIANIATSYYTLITLDEQLKVSKENIELLQKSTTTMESMMQAGLLNGASVEQSKALLFGTQATIPDLESKIRQMESTICVMLGQVPTSIYRKSIQEQVIASELKQGVPAQMLAKRPDVQQAELAFRAAFELKNAAQASFYPSITLSTGSMIGYGASSLSGFFKPEHLFANIIGGLAQPVFAKKRLTGNLKIAKAQEKEALLTFEKTVLAAGKEVSDVLFAFDASQRKTETRSKQVQSLLNAVDFTQALLIAGEARYTDVLSAQQSLLQAQLSQVNDLLEQLQYSVTLYKALGGGVE